MSETFIKIDLLQHLKISTEDKTILRTCQKSTLQQNRMLRCPEPIFMRVGYVMNHVFQQERLNLFLCLRADVSYFLCCTLIVFQRPPGFPRSWEHAAIG